MNANATPLLFPEFAAGSFAYSHWGQMGPDVPPLQKLTLAILLWVAGCPEWDFDLSTAERPEGLLACTNPAPQGPGSPSCHTWRTTVRSCRV